MPRIVFISDTHRRKIEVPDGDILVHCGDMTEVGTEGEIAEFAAWIYSLPHKDKVIIAGNHDWLFEKDNQRARKLVRLSGVHYLQDSGKKVQGIRFWGTPWTNDFGEWAFMKNSVRKTAAFRRIPKETEILVSHGPPQGILDTVEYVIAGRPRKCHAGSGALKYILEEKHFMKADAKLRVVAFGHIHEGYGQMDYRGVRFINCSIMDGWYRPKNAPVVLDYP